MATTSTRMVSRPRFHSLQVTSPPALLPRWAAFLLSSGIYLTFRGYHSFDGDQAYRLPLLLHRQDPALFATDPFVRAFDAFNPHRGYLALLDLASRPLGLSAGLSGLFALTMAATAVGIDRLARAVWPACAPRVGLVAFVLVLMAKAGNVGTNHLFEGTLLDRLIGFALGWLAMAAALENPRKGAWSSAPWIGIAAIVHPSVGLQLGLTLAVAWIAWAACPGRSGVGRKQLIVAMGFLGLALVPGLAMMTGQGGRLFSGLPTEEFRRLAVKIQGPQHMLPSTWRTPQWLAWGCYPVLAVLALSQAGVANWPAARVRLALLIIVNLASLAMAYLAVEVVGDLRVTVFQPFRMATIARGLALVAVSGRVIGLWERGDLVSRMRAVLVGVGLSGDWMLVVATAVDLAMTLAEGLRLGRIASTGLGLSVLTSGLIFLGHHDTESGHLALLSAIGALATYTLLTRRRHFAWTPRKIRLAMAVSWAVPASAAMVPLVVANPSSHGWASALVERCRFSETPTDDLERLAVWCRDHTPASSSFIGPPGPKTFRLWSRRSLVFNRAGSPYHAEGLADWAGRYREHVSFVGSTVEFAEAYLADRHALEARFQAMSDSGLARLADRQGATHVLRAMPRDGTANTNHPLELLHAEGRYAVYRVHPREQIPEKNLAGGLFNSN